MTKTEHTSTAKRKTYVRDMGDGIRLEAEVSPCVFMYAGYPLQIQVTLHRHAGECLGDALAVDRTKTASTYKRTDVERLLRAVRIAPCPRCSSPAFDPATVETNRTGLCEVCFMGDLKSKYAANEEAEQRKIAARDRRMKRKGMVVRISGWVHPQGGGDDYQVDWYLNAAPTPDQVRKLLSEQGSSVLDDYQIIEL